MKLLRIKRKSAILKAPAFGCLRHTPTINVTVGCSHKCVYCYARGFTGAPPPGEVHLYENLPEALERELDRKRRLPAWVCYSSASDAFQDVDEVRDVAYRTMELLLSRGIGIGFLTKGAVPGVFLDLFSRHARLVKARIGLVSLGDEYARMFEPHAARPLARLRMAGRLHDMGVDTVVRMDPLIHGLTDSEETLDHLLKRVKQTGVSAISASSLTIRPTLMKHFTEELPGAVREKIMAPYRGQPFQRVITSASTRLLPKTIRMAQYSHVKRIAARYAIRCSICGCKNPDLPFESCNPWLDGEEESRAGLGILFNTAGPNDGRLRNPDDGAQENREVLPVDGR